MWLLKPCSHPENITHNSYYLLAPKAAHVGDFPGGPVVKASPSNAGGAGSISGQGAKIPHASWPKNQNIKRKQYCNKFNKDFKNGPHQKKKKKILKKKAAQVGI